MLTATDLEVAGITSVEVDGGRDFEITVPVAQLLKYLRKVEESEITLFPKCRRVQPHPIGKGEEGPLEPEIEVAHGIIIEHSDASLSIDGMSSESYPELPKTPAVQFEIGGLEKAIPRTLVSISKEQSRFTLNGALLDVCAKSARFISTDGHRLAIVDAELIDPTEKMRVLIPQTALAELARLGDCAGVSANKDHVFFTRGERTILARKLTGNFPDWERVVPKSFKYQVELQNEPLRKLIDRVALFADERSRTVHVAINGAFELSARCEGNAVSGRVPFAGPKFAYPYESGFSAPYLLDFLKSSAEDSVTLSFGKASEAVAFACPGYQYVLMPMRENNCDPCAEGEFEVVPGSEKWDEVAEPAEVAQPEATQPVAQPEASSDAAETADLIDALALAAIKGVYVATIYNWVKQGRLPQPQKCGRKAVWSRAEVLR
jgi:DNA polymerase-3 subunit beta